MEKKIQNVKDILKTLTDKIQDKETIDELAKLTSAIDEVEKENNELLDKNKELITSYKEVVLHSNFSKPEQTIDEVVGKKEVTFEDVFLK